MAVTLEGLKVRVDPIAPSTFDAETALRAELR